MLRETFQARGPTGIEPCLYHRVAIGGRRQTRVDRECSLTVVLGKGDSHDRMRRQPGAASGAVAWRTGVDDPLWLHNLAKDALARVDGSIGSAHLQAKDAARPQVDFAAK